MSAIKLKKMPLAVVIAATMANHGAIAQEQQAGRTVLEEIIVTSQKRVENLQDTPIAISAFGTDDLERRQLVNTRDLVGSVASMSGMESSPGRGNFSISMRGISGGNPQSLSTDPAVAVYYDGVYHGKQIASTMDVADIERIEVLRGPQGTLYGRNATAGAINFITRKPSGEFHIKGTASVGNENLRGIKLNVDLPALGDANEGIGSLSTSLGYSSRTRDEFYGNTNPNLDGFEDLDREAFRFAARWELGDDFTADYVYSQGKLDELGPLAKTIGQVAQDASGTTYSDQLKGMRAGGFFLGTSQRTQDSVDATIAQLEAVDAAGKSRPSKGSSDSPSSVVSESISHSLSLNWEAGEWGVLGDVSFASITGYSKVENVNIGDIDGLDSSIDATGVGAINPLTLMTMLTGAEPLLNPLIDQFGGGHYSLRMEMNYESFSQEFQMVGSTESVDYVFGLYYYEDEGENRNFQRPLAPIGGISRVNYDNSTQAEAFFTQATYRPIDPLAITVGARYSKETKDVTYLYEKASPFTTPGYDGLTTSPVPGQFGEKFDENYYNASGMINVAYDISNDVMVYATVSNGFHSGYFNGDAFAGDKPLEEEIITNYEIGVKSSWFDSRLQVNASVFRYEFDDIQVSQTAIIDGNLSSFYVNAGAATRDGFEMDIKLLPVEDLVLSVSYAYLDGTYDKYPEHCGIVSGTEQCIPLVDEADRARTPDHAVRFYADYVFARTDYAEFTGLLGVDWQEEAAASAVWTGSYTDGTPTVSPDIMNDERTLVSLRLAAENIEVGDGRMTVALSGQNLLDDDHSTMGINFGRQLGVVTQNYGTPRTYMLEVSYEY